MGLFKKDKLEAAETAPGNAGVVYHKNWYEWGSFLEDRFENTDAPVEKVDFYESPSSQDERGQRNGGEQTYVISTVSEHPKYSDNYLSCTGVIIMGRDRETGKRLSLLTHQDVLLPSEIIRNFISDLKDAATEMYQRIDPASLSVGFVGSHPFFSEEYNAMCNEVKKILKDVVGKEVTIISDPIWGGTAVFVDTEAGLVHVAAGSLQETSKKEPKPTRRFAYDANRKRDEKPLVLPIER